MNEGILINRNFLLTKKFLLIKEFKPFNVVMKTLFISGSWSNLPTETR